MGMVTLHINASEVGAIQAFRRLETAQQKAELASRRLELQSARTNRRVGQMKGELGAVDRQVMAVAASATAMIGSFMTLGGAINLIRRLDQHLGDVRQKQIEIGEGALDLQRKMLGLAEQEENRGRAGLLETTRNAFRTAQAGSIEIETAGQIRNAVQSFFKFAPQGQQEEMAALIAQAIGKTGGTGDEGAALAQLLKNFGVKDTEQAREAIAKINQSLTDHPEMGAGKLAMMTLKGGIAMGVLGGGAEDMLSYSAQARMVTGSPDEGAELMRQVLQNTLGQDAALGIVQRQLGLKTLDAAREQPAHVIMKAMGDAIGGALQEAGVPGAQRLLKDVEGRTRIQLLRFYSPEAMATGEQVRAGLERADVGAMEADYAAAAGTDVAVAQRQENERRMRRTEQAATRFTQTELNKEAQARLEELRASGKIGFWGDWATPDETDLSSIRDAIQHEALGLKSFDDNGVGAIRPWPLVPIGGTGQSQLLTAAKKAMGLPETEPVLSRDQLTSQQLESLRSFIQKDARKFGEMQVGESGLYERTVDEELHQKTLQEIDAELKLRQKRSGASQGTGTQGGPGPQAAVIQNFYGDQYLLGNRDRVAGDHPNLPTIGGMA